MCTGFVKSPFKIDKNKIKITLLTENNLLKETTNIVPYNGFYAIPIYNTGKYILKIISNTDVIFDPPFFKLDLQNFDNNIKNKEFNFNALGYEIKGKIEDLIDINRVAVKLESLDGEIVKMETVNNDGEFKFIVIPGEYSISILTSQATCFHKSQYTINVIDSSVEIPITYISGYFITININGLNDLNSRIKLQISSDKKLFIENCITIKNNKKYKCIIEISTQSPNIIKCLPKGKYIIKPMITNDTGILFLPHEKEIEIDNENINISFEIDTFRVYGKTLANGIPINDVKIYNENEYIATSDNEGNFIWNNVRKGTYNIEAKKDGIIFTPIKAILDVNNQVIQPFNVVKFRVSGHVTLENNRTEKIDLSIESLIINAKLSIRTNEQGKFLIFLPIGNYSITVNDKKHGFVPRTHLAIFKDKPLDNIIFSKLKIDIIIILKIFENTCENIIINMKDDEEIFNKKQSCSGNEIVFKNVSPGTFTISIHDENLYCWKENSVKKFITGNDDNIIVFVQTGYFLKFYSPIETTLNVIEKESNILYPINVKNDINMLCVSNKGQYKILNNDCYVFEESSSELSVNENSIKHIMVKEFIIAIGIEMVDIIINDPLPFNVKIINNKNIYEKIYVTEIEPNNNHTLKLNIDNKYEESTFLITPISKNLIMEPKFIKINFDKNCQMKKNLFKFYKGHFIEGKISSYVNGVVVKYVDEENNIKLNSFVKENGTFIIGPLKYINDKYLSLEKKKYKFVLIKKDTVYLYKTIELSTLYIEFKNNITGEFIKNVMVTIYSESSYLTKNVASKGTLKITDLEEGNYIISPFRQEYHFYNTSKIIKVESKKLNTLILYGIQISYSIFGKITYPNNDPLPNKYLQGISKDCNSSQEIGLTDKNGEYRIPNLYPFCTYKITVQNKKNTNFYTFPKDYTIMVKDSPIQNINFIYFKLSNQNLEVYVKIDLIDIPVQNFIEIGIYRIKEKTPVLKKILIKEQLSFFVSKLPLDNETYIIKIDKISDSRFKYQYNSGIFKANTTFQFLKIILEPKKFNSEIGVPPGNIIGLIITTLIVFIFFNTENIKLIILFLIDYWKYMIGRETLFGKERLYGRRR
ncbi:Nodal modulator 1 [Strongyloides ratti]|uniref:Nodal modulator 1 n=1 Tax=Strongyloides ratti TaxID=34506 RepID=A0A090LHG8_STRRB|nr:Nodal modulator 1 [Strongyloides ratti]CEF67598.1 Nodal modulator 1 [Strongyloides ratti]